MRFRTAVDPDGESGFELLYWRVPIMKFNSSTEDEIAARAIWPRGVYPFQILDAEEKLSASKRNPMIELKIEIRRGDGSTRIVRDYLLVQRPQKLLHAAIVCGVLEKYQRGLLGEDDFVGKRGNLKLGIQKSHDYPSRNVVVDYVYGPSDEQPERPLGRRPVAGP